MAEAKGAVMLEENPAANNPNPKNHTAQDPKLFPKVSPKAA